MAITNYTELKSAIADFLNRDDLTSAIPTFITLTEKQLERALRTRDMIERSSAQIDSQFSALPADFLEVKSAKVTSTTPIRHMEYVSINQMDQMDEEDSGASGIPEYYTIEGAELRVHPTPSTTYDIELAYYESLPQLSDSTTTNWLLTKYPDVYLYGALTHSAPYLQEDGRLGTWGALFKESLESVRLSDDRATYGDGPLNIRVKHFGR